MFHLLLCTLNVAIKDGCLLHFRRPSSRIPMTTPPHGASMPRPNTQKPGETKDSRPLPPTASSGADDLVLYGDIEPLKFVFINAQRKLISTSVPDSVLVKIQAYPGGVSKFFEDAVSAFNGDLRALVEAAVQFVDDRRVRAPEDPARNASVRVFPETYEKIQKIQTALITIRGMSRAKVIAGLIQLKLKQRSRDVD